MSRLYVSACLFNLYAEYITWNAGLDETEAGIKIAGRNINNLRYIRWHHSYDESERGQWKVQFSSVTQSCPTLWDPMNLSTPGLPVHHQLSESTQSHVYQVGDAIQLSHPLSSPSPPALNLSQHQGLFQWVSSSHQVAKVFEFQLQYQFFQWTPRTHLL